MPLFYLLCLCWNAALTVAAVAALVILLRHRKYFIATEARQRRLGDQMADVARLLVDHGVRTRAQELRRKWSEEPPFDDLELQAKCLQFLNIIDQQVGTEQGKKNEAS